MDFRLTMQDRIKFLPRTTIPENHLEIRIPHSRVLKLVARSLLLGFVILTFPWLGSVMRIPPNSTSSSMDQIVPSMIFPMLFQDLINEGLFKSSDKALYIQNGNLFKQIMLNNEVGLISETPTAVTDNTFDLVFATDYSDSDTQLIDRALKNNGVVVVQLSNDISKAFHKPENYKIVYLRQFDSTVVAMRKMWNSEMRNLPAKRRLLMFGSKAKKAALDGLEDVLLEPPRGSPLMYSSYMKKTRYLPDLMGDLLDEYPRRVFIDVGGVSTEWFKRTYPRKNQVFEMYKVEMVSEEPTSAQIEVSDWLRKNVREEEYVVMKADAEAVEELMASKAITLVDELFLECKHQWQKKNKGTRAYWQCLSLYGRLRDEGIAVHQWWG